MCKTVLVLFVVLKKHELVPFLSKLEYVDFGASCGQSGTISFKIIMTCS